MEFASLSSRSCKISGYIEPEIEMAADEGDTHQSFVAANENGLTLDRRSPSLFQLVYDQRNPKIKIAKES